MLDNNLNQDGLDKYEMANFIKIADSYIVNQMYFNSSKLGLHSHSIAQSYIRDIDIYKLYYKSNVLLTIKLRLLAFSLLFPAFK